MSRELQASSLKLQGKAKTGLHPVFPGPSGLRLRRFAQRVELLQGLCCLPFVGAVVPPRCVTAAALSRSDDRSYGEASPAGRLLREQPKRALSFPCSLKLIAHSCLLQPEVYFLLREGVFQVVEDVFGFAVTSNVLGAHGFELVVTNGQEDGVVGALLRFFYRGDAVFVF